MLVAWFFPSFFVSFILFAYSAEPVFWSAAADKNCSEETLKPLDDVNARERFVLRLWITAADGTLMQFFVLNSLGVEEGDKSLILFYSNLELLFLRLSSNQLNNETNPRMVDGQELFDLQIFRGGQKEKQPLLGLS